MANDVSVRVQNADEWYIDRGETLLPPRFAQQRRRPEHGGRGRILVVENRSHGRCEAKGRTPQHSDKAALRSNMPVSDRFRRQAHISRRLPDNCDLMRTRPNVRANLSIGQHRSGQPYACAKTCCRCPALTHSRAPAAPATAVRRESFGSLSQECRAKISPPSSKLPSSTRASKPPGTSRRTPAPARHSSMRTSSWPPLKRGISLTPSRCGTAKGSSSLVSMLTCAQSAGSN